MDDAEFERLSASLLEGEMPDWDALERTTPPERRARLDALRAIAQVAAISRDALGQGQPERWAGFDLIEPVGHGGYGEVWRAHDPQLDRDVALKLIPAEAEDVEDILREGRLLARIRHPNVAAIYGASYVDGEIGVAMEFVGGDDLERIVRRNGPLQPREVMDIGLQLARALDAVHRAGVLHRDIKASNVKRTDDGRIILLDFGSSRELRLHTTGPSAEAGTPLYLAPEVLAGGNASVQSDLYSLGVLLYFVATGRYPIQAATLEELRAKHAQVGGDLLTLRRKRLPRKLLAVVNETLAQSPARRPRSAADVVARLRNRRHVYAGAAAVLVAVVAIAGVAARRFPARTSGFGADPSTASRKLEFAIAPGAIGRPSLDGRLLPFVDRRNGGLALMHIDTGAIDLLTTDSDVVGRFADASVASPDGSRIAYEWFGDDMNDRELRIVDTTTRAATVLWHTPDYRTSVEPTAWSHDGTRIAGVLEAPDGTRDVFVSELGHTAPRLFPTATAAWPSFSDDDRFVVFGRPDPKTDLSALWVIDLSDGRLNKINLVGSNEQMPIWINGELVFVSERDGASAVWRVSIDHAGRPIGLPTEITGSAGVTELLGVTSAGNLLCRRSEGTSQVVIANLDGSAPQQVSSGPGAHFSPDWSYDGRRLAYLTEPRQGPLRHLLKIRDLAAGTEQVFDALGSSFGKPGRIGYNPRLSPDGTRVLLRGPRGFFVYDFATRQESKPFFGGREYGDVEWDDESHVFVLEFDRGIWVLNLATEEARQIFSVPPHHMMGRGIAVSPDRSRVAFATLTGPGIRSAEISTVDRNGSGVRTLVSRERQRPYAAVPAFAAVPLLLGQWTADGRDVLFASTDVLPSGYTRWNTDLWAVPADGGAPYRTGLSSPGLRDIRPDPNGRRVASTLYTFHSDVLVLPNALRQTTDIH